MYTTLLQANNALMQILMLVFIVAILYFFMIRPQMKRQKELRKFQEALGKGDKVLVAGGIFGRVAEVRDDSIIVEVESGTKIRVLKSSVYRDATDVNTQPTSAK